MIKFRLYLLIILLLTISCYKESISFRSELTNDFLLPTLIKFNHKSSVYDHNSNRLRFPINLQTIEDYRPYIEFHEDFEVFFNNIPLFNNSINSLGTIAMNEQYEFQFRSGNHTKVIYLTFTNLPILQIITPSQIYDEPKAIAKLHINHPDKPNDITHYIGIEHRGGYSQRFSKKSFGFEIRKNDKLEENISESLLGMPANNDWILDAMMIDHSRMRNKTSFEIWNAFNGQQQPGIKSQFVEVYLNDSFHGLYALNSTINAESLNLQNDGVLYKAFAWADGATKFEKYESKPPEHYLWDGWEQKFPKPKISIYWEPLDELRELVVQTEETTFEENIDKLIDLENFIDYYLFLNLIDALDNTGKNNFLVKFNNSEPFHIIPWDLDGSWGILWNGSHIEFDHILTNHLFDRLLQTKPILFKSRLKDEWKAKRQIEFTNDALKERFSRHLSMLKTSDIIDMENQRWNLNINLEEEQNYLFQWLEKRLIFLDEYYENL